ncbi:hypothetical protein DL96DRAFT_1716224 [Flagelloscypha sp. PMI_526]|nr:hypothetical protein DL96DRAFT_1716224 [Flagelloscypha sp. PMI_526]
MSVILPPELERVIVELAAEVHGHMASSALRLTSRSFCCCLTVEDPPFYVLPTHLTRLRRLVIWVGFTEFNELRVPEEIAKRITHLYIYIQGSASDVCSWLSRHHLPSLTHLLLLSSSGWLRNLKIPATVSSIISIAEVLPTTLECCIFDTDNVYKEEDLSSGSEDRALLDVLMGKVDPRIMFLIGEDRVDDAVPSNYILMPGNSRLVWEALGVPQPTKKSTFWELAESAVKSRKVKVQKDSLRK